MSHVFNWLLLLVQPKKRTLRVFRRKYPITSLTLLFVCLSVFAMAQLTRGWLTKMDNSIIVTLGSWSWPRKCSIPSQARKGHKICPLKKKREETPLTCRKKILTGKYQGACMKSSKTNRSDLYVAHVKIPLDGSKTGIQLESRRCSCQETRVTCAHDYLCVYTSCSFQQCTSFWDRAVFKSDPLSVLLVVHPHKRGNQLDTGLTNSFWDVLQMEHRDSQTLRWYMNPEAKEDLNPNNQLGLLPSDRLPLQSYWMIMKNKWFISPII